VEPRFRAAYNAAFTPRSYERYKRNLRERLGCEAGFRLAETPVFVPLDLVANCERAASEIVTQLAEPARREQLRAAVPARFDAGVREGKPQFAVVDFGIVRTPEGSFEPRVVELQGFPSLLAFEMLQYEAWARELEAIMPEHAWACWHGGRDGPAFLELARRAIVGDADPAEVALVDFEPERQKTYCDFAATRLLFGVEPCDPRALYVRRSRLYRRDAAGRERPVTRIYNRMVGDDLERFADALPFDVRDELEVTWAPHPAWFWQWSKASLPRLDHPAVAPTRLVSEYVAGDGPALADCVLKPLFSFAGAGVNLRPTSADLAAIPSASRSGWCVQERISYAAAFETPAGAPVKVELRVLLVRPDDAAELLPAINLCRLARGEMLGVNFNRDHTWVGSSLGIWKMRPDARA